MIRPGPNSINWGIKIQSCPGRPRHGFNRRVLISARANFQVPHQQDRVTMTSTMSHSTSLANSPPPQFTPLEQELLQEYARLVSNMNTVPPYDAS